MAESPFTLPPDERIYLRTLARRQADLAALPVMAQRKAQWIALNDGKPNARPPIIEEIGRAGF